MAAFNSMSAEWLSNLADKIERGEAIKPCPKALRRVAAQLESIALPDVVTDGWRDMDDPELPKDGTDCLFYSPGRKSASNKNAVKPHTRVDCISSNWPRGHYQYPEAPYTHWRELPSPPADRSE